MCVDSDGESVKVGKLAAVNSGKCSSGVHGQPTLTTLGHGLAHADSYLGSGWAPCRRLTPEGCSVPNHKGLDVLSHLGLLCGSFIPWGVCMWWGGGPQAVLTPDCSQTSFSFPSFFLLLPSTGIHPNILHAKLHLVCFPGNPVCDISQNMMRVV